MFLNRKVEEHIKNPDEIWDSSKRAALYIKCYANGKHWLKAAALLNEHQGKWRDLRGEAEHTHVLPDVPAVEELGEGQVGAWRGCGLWIQLCRKQTRTETGSLFKSQFSSTWPDLVSLLIKSSVISLSFNLRRDRRTKSNRCCYSSSGSKRGCL